MSSPGEVALLYVWAVKTLAIWGVIFKRKLCLIGPPLAVQHCSRTALLVRRRAVWYSPECKPRTSYGREERKTHWTHKIGMTIPGLSFSLGWQKFLSQNLVGSLKRIFQVTLL